MKADRSSIGLSLLALALVGCSGGGDAQSCGQVPPCGGDVVGTWRNAGFCYDVDNFVASVATQLGLSCPTGVSPVQTASDSDRALSLVFSSDGTYSGTSTWSGSISLMVPAACLQEQSCADLDAAIGVFVDPNNGVVAAACSGMSSCSCTFTYGGAVDQTGTYTTSGSTLETTTSTGTVGDTPYCVSGASLHLDYLVGTQVTSDSVLTRE